MELFSSFDSFLALLLRLILDLFLVNTAEMQACVFNGYIMFIHFFEFLHYSNINIWAPTMVCRRHYCKFLNYFWMCILNLVPSPIETSSSITKIMNKNILKIVIFALKNKMGLV